MAEPIELTDDTFDREVVENDGTVVVDFSGEWCPHCKQLEPVIRELAEDYGDDVKICTLNVTDNAQSAARYSVLGIPTVIIFKNGEPVETHVGFAPKDKLKAKIDAVAAA